MSRYPANPLWDHDRDEPFMILDEASWKAAEDAGHLTVEHVLARLENMAEYEFANGAELGLAPDGFFNALVADAWQMTRNVKIRMWPNDHPPPHVHIEFKDRPESNLKLSIETGELLDGTAPPGQGKHLKNISAFVIERAPMLMARWTEMQAAARPTS